MYVSLRSRQSSKAWSNRSRTFTQLAVASFELREFLSARAFLERLFATGWESPEGLLLAVQTETELGADNLALDYATRLKSNFPSSDESKRLMTLIGEVSNG